MILKDNNQEVSTINENFNTPYIGNQDNEYSDMKNLKQNTQEIVNKVEDLNQEELSIKNYLINLLPNLLVCANLSYISLIERHFCGKENTNLVTGIGLGSIFSNYICTYVGYAIGDSICVIAAKYFGNKNHYYVGQTRNLIVILILLLVLLYSILAFLFPKILLKYLTTQSYSIIKIAAGYIKCSFFKIFLDLLFDVMKNYFQSQLIYLPLMISLITSYILYPLFACLFITRLKMGYVGAALASTLDTFIKLKILLIYNFFFNPYPESNVGFNSNTFEWDHVSKTIKIAFHNIFSLISETYGWALVLIFTARLDSNKYSLFVIMESIVLLNIQFVIGWTITNIVLVGNYVGEMKPDLVRKTINYSFLSFIIIYTPLMIGFFVFKRQILNFFSDDPNILKFEQNSVILSLIGISLIFDCLVNIYGGILRGLGKEKFTSIVNFIFFFLLFPSLAFFLAFIEKFEILGIFLAYIIIYTITTLIYMIYFYCFVDIEQICRSYVINSLILKS